MDGLFALEFGTVSAGTQEGHDSVCRLGAKMQMMKWLVLALVISSLGACGDVVGYKSDPAPSPGEDAPLSRIQLHWVEWSDDEPEPGSNETFDFVVKLSNLGQRAFAWTNPCPTYHWSWVESATDYGLGFGYLNCSGLPSLPSGETREFRIEIPAADKAGASTLQWELVDPRSCNFMTMGFDRGKAYDPGPTADDLGCGSAY